VTGADAEPRLRFERGSTLSVSAAARTGSAAAATGDAANEVAVAAFLDGRLGFTMIPAMIERVMNDHQKEPVSSVDVVRRVDGWARERAAALTGELELR
jgi:1-deoxy-D-xylulose-5-phosphate reductoisomerase